MAGKVHSIRRRREILFPIAAPPRRSVYEVTSRASVPKVEACKRTGEGTSVFIRGEQGASPSPLPWSRAGESGLGSSALLGIRQGPRRAKC